MATEKQIMANRRNAKRSTGPRTAAGKSISSRNAFRHGLSRSPDSDETTQAKMEALARAIARENPDDERREAAIEAAAAHLEIERVCNVRIEMLSMINLTSVTPKELWRLLAVDRDEARAKRSDAVLQPKSEGYPPPQRLLIDLEAGPYQA
jgi:hypothetical protein